MRTMMRSHQNKKSMQKGVAVWAALLGLFVIIFFTPARSVATKVVMWVAHPTLLLGRATSDGISSFVRTFSSTRTLIAENTALKDQIQELELRLLDRNTLAQENDELRDLLGRTPASSGVLASVLAGPGSTPYDILLVDIGSDEHVAVGDRVMVGDNVIIGTIIEVYARTAKAELFSSPGKAMDVTLPGTNAFVTATGRGGGNFEMMLPRDVDIENGTPVFVPGTSRIVGVILGSEGDPTDPFKKVFLRTPINPATIHFVRIVTVAQIP